MYMSLEWSLNPGPQDPVLHVLDVSLLQHTWFKWMVVNRLLLSLITTHSFESGVLEQGIIENIQENGLWGPLLYNIEKIQVLGFLLKWLGVLSGVCGLAISLAQVSFCCGARAHVTVDKLSEALQTTVEEKLQVPVPMFPILHPNTHTRETHTHETHTWNTVLAIKDQHTVLDLL